MSANQVEKYAYDCKTSVIYNDGVHVVYMASENQGNKREGGDKKQQGIVQSHNRIVAFFYNGKQSHVRHPDTCYDIKSQGEAYEYRCIFVYDRDEGKISRRYGKIDEVQNQ